MFIIIVPNQLVLLQVAYWEHGQLPFLIHHSKIILTLVYVFSPIDIIPDFFPGIGSVDDAGMVLLCIAAARADIEDFRRWAKANNPKLLK